MARPSAACVALLLAAMLVCAHAQIGAGRRRSPLFSVPPGLAELIQQQTRLSVGTPDDGPDVTAIMQSIRNRPTTPAESAQRDVSHLVEV